MTERTAPNIVWVVEMWSEINRKFEPTVGVRLTRDEGRIELRAWSVRNSSERFRLKKYGAIS